MMLLTKVDRRRLPKLGVTDGHGMNAIAYVKIFSPVGRYTFFVTEFDGDDTLYGYVLSPMTPDYDEWGYVSLKELETTIVWSSLGMERDYHFKPKPMKEALKQQGVHMEENPLAIADKDTTYGKTTYFLWFERPQDLGRAHRDLKILTIEYATIILPQDDNGYPIRITVNRDDEEEVDRLVSRWWPVRMEKR